MPPPKWTHVLVVWWLMIVGTALVAVGLAVDYGLSWWVGVGAGCWLLAAVYTFLTQGER